MGNNSEFVLVDEVREMLRDVTTEVLGERGLNDIVKLSAISPKIDSDLYLVGLKQKTGRSMSKYHSFTVDPTNALTGPGGGLSEETLKKMVREEMEKILPKEHEDEIRDAWHKHFGS